jgi:LysR family transcriptional regulator, hydrogen peroxide-inducible genes activator
LRQGDIDCAILADPFSDHGLMTQPLYDEPFVVAIPKHHEWARRKSINSQELKAQTMLLLGSGHCFRDQVLEVCPELSRFSQANSGIQRTFEGSSLETIRHMVASGVGITVMPQSAKPINGSDRSLLKYLPFDAQSHAPHRRVSLVWRKTFSRSGALEALRQGILASQLPGVKMLPKQPSIPQSSMPH